MKNHHEPLWETAFQSGNVAEHTRQEVGYNTEVITALRGRSKQLIIQSMREMDLCGPLVTQHALLLMTRFGSSVQYAQMGISGAQEVAITGSGPYPLLRLLAEEQTGSKLQSDLSDREYWQMVIDERQRFRDAALHVMTEQQLPYALRQYPNGSWMGTPENFGDVLCECRKVLQQLLGGAKRSLRRHAAEGWQTLVAAPKKEMCENDSDICSICEGIRAARRAQCCC